MKTKILVGLAMRKETESEKEELIRKVCDKQTTDALGMLRSINPGKYKIVEKRVLSHFERFRAVVGFDTYLGLIKDIDAEMSISFHRRDNSFGLDNIEE